MLRVYFLETLVEVANTWLPEPWFQPTECYRDLDLARDRFEFLLEWTLERKIRDAPELRARCRAEFGGLDLELPPTRSCCRLVTAKGSNLLLGTLDRRGRLRRQRREPLARPMWSNRRRTFFTLSSRPPWDSRGREMRLLANLGWPRHPDIFWGFRRQRDAIEHGRDFTGVRSLHRLDLELEVLERRWVGIDENVAEATLCEA